MTNSQTHADAPGRQASGRGPKPAKPWPEFPLYAHAAGVWAKRIRGKVHYFGPWRDPDGALKEYLRQRDHLHGGLTPPAGDDLTLDELVNRYLVAQRTRAAIGEISARQFLDCKRDGRRVLESLGRQRPAASLTPDDFAALRAEIFAGRNATTVANIIVRIRSIFAWGLKNEHNRLSLNESQLVTGRYGPAFKLPTARARRQAARAAGPRFFEAAQVRALLAATEAHANLHAMILLGINAGLGNTDCSELRADHLDARAGILTYPRPKTGADRRAVLWPQTVDAIAAAVRAVDVDGRVFVTRQGLPYVRLNAHDTLIDSISMQFAALLRRTGLHRPGLGFYALRHTFRTVADETKDFPAVDLVMGHTPSDAGGAPFAAAMGARYRQRIDDDRLQAISDHLAAWLNR